MARLEANPNKLREDLERWAETRANPQFVRDVASLLPGAESVAFDLVGPLAMTREGVTRALRKLIDESRLSSGGTPTAREMTQLALRNAVADVEQMPQPVLDQIRKVEWMDPFEQLLSGANAAVSPVETPATRGLIEEMFRRHQQKELLPLGWAHGQVPFDMSFHQFIDEPYAGVHELSHLKHFIGQESFPEYELVKSLLDANRHPERLNLAEALGRFRRGSDLGAQLRAERNWTPRPLQDFIDFYMIPNEMIAESRAIQRTGQITPPGRWKREFVDIGRVGEELKKSALMMELLRGGR